MKIKINHTLTITLLIFFVAVKSHAQGQATGYSNIKQARIQQIQTLLNVSPQQAQLMYQALTYKLEDIWAFKKVDSQSAPSQHQILEILLAQRKAKIDSIMTPAQQVLFAQKQKQINAEAVALIKQRSAQTLERLRHPVSGGTYKPATQP